ncbi:MAG: extracellular solute-binding protein, partial [Clostridia bacterium]|nr:extracellular solute-binding protein [Clostridia bacterium]
RLSDFYYKRPIFDNLVVKNTNITYSDDLIEVPRNVRPASKRVIIRPKEVDLTALVESGALDYFFIYKSVAKQHGLKFVELPVEVNLKDVSFAETYKRVSVKLGSTGKIVKGMPITYGITVLKNAPHRKLALQFLAYMLKEGRSAFTENYHDFMKTPIALGNIPKEIENMVKKGNE